MDDGASVCGDVTRARQTMTDQANGPASDALVIARLAALTRGDYDRVRRKEADQLGWRVETLDAEVAKARRVATSCSQEVTDRPPEFTDEALALRFTELHQFGSEIRPIALMAVVPCGLAVARMETFGGVWRQPRG